MFSLLVSMRKRLMRKRERFYVESDEPFEDAIIVRGPFSRKDAQDLMFINGACGSKDRLYEDVGGGTQIPH